jgi:hypothetical protein
MRDRVLSELLRKRTKNTGTPGDAEYEKYLKLSNQMNTNEL